MAFFRALFGQSKKIETSKQNKNEVQRAIQDLEEREQQIVKKIESLRKQCDILLQSAKDAMALNPKSETQKTIAGKYLKKKKMIEKEIESLTNAEERLMEQRIAIETQTMQGDTLSVMDKANKIVPKLDTDAAAKVLDEITERVQDSEEVNDIFSRPIGTGVDISNDMAELEAEFTSEAATVPKNIPTTSNIVEIPIQFPSVPSGPVKVSSPQNVKKINSFERELAELEAL